MNSVGNAYCDKCNARLIPMAALPPEEPESETDPIKGLSLPSIPPEEEREPQIEDLTEEAGAEGAAVDDWLAQIRASTEEEAEEPQEPEFTADVEPTEIPDWLRDMGPIGVETQATAGQERPVAEAPLETPAMPAPARAEIPDWLREMPPPVDEPPKATPEQAPPEIMPPMAEPAPAPAEIPDWLSEMRPVGVETQATADEERLTAKAPWEETPAMPTPAEIPDWLQKMAPPEEALPEAAPPVAEPALAPAEIPDWLSEMAPPEEAPPEAAPPVAEPALAPAEIPDWLSEMAPPEEAPPEAAPPVAEPALAPAEIPDWLSEMAPPEEAPPEAAPPVAEPALAPIKIPDWLHEMAPSEESPPEPEAAPPVAEPALAEPPTKETAPPSPPPFTGIPSSIVIETPEWLRESITPETEAIETPEWLAELEASPILPSAAVVAAFESETSPLPPEPGIGVAEAGDLAQAEIPDWLQTLRPRPEVAEAVVEEELAETEGLLQGLRSLLPPALPIEAPTVRESVLPAEAGEASLARAQLLQSLLTQPDQVPRSEERKQDISIGEQTQRWLVAAVLLAAVLGILIPPLMGFDVPILTQPATFPAAIRRIEFQQVMNLHTAVQNTSAGDTVLIAFEYGPPEADELDLVAEPILRHLLDQGAHISIVSTQPEGLVVAAGLLNDIAAPEGQYTLTSYRPGDATAVSSLLTDAGTHPELIVVLTARPAPLRWWVEQARALGDTPPVVAGVSASLQIAASPYLDASAGQLKGAISGLSGAAAYETHRGLAGWATQRFNALAAGHIAIVGLMVLGAIVYTFGGLHGRKK